MSLNGQLWIYLTFPVGSIHISPINQQGRIAMALWRF